MAGGSGGGGIAGTADEAKVVSAWEAATSGQDVQMDNTQTQHGSSVAANTSSSSASNSKKKKKKGGGDGGKK